MAALHPCPARIRVPPAQGVPADATSSPAAGAITGGRVAVSAADVALEADVGRIAEAGVREVGGFDPGRSFRDLLNIAG